jgi:hypothetical protein
MNKHEIESRLDRSLASQVRVPKLDRRFDAAVWSRIEAETRAQQPVVPVPAATSGAQRWLLASNIAGFVVAAILVVNFGMRMLGSVHIDTSALPMPTLSPEQTDQGIKIIGWVITGAALAFGLMFTSLGRRLRSEFT